MICQPRSAIVAGPSGSGKSELVEQVLIDKKLFYHPPKKWCIVTIVGNLDLIA